MKMRVHKLLLLCIVSMIIVFFVSPSPAQPHTDPSLLRLHVRANSDAPVDQALKYQVRNAVLDVLAQHLAMAGNADAARENVTSALPEVLSAAEDVVADAGFDYPVSAVLGEEDFPTRLYGDKVYRAGRYHALQIYLGEGSGQNWWCVLFPPLCFVEAAPDSAIPVTSNQPEPLRPRFRLLDWLQRIFNN